MGVVGQWQVLEGIVRILVFILKEIVIKEII